MFRRPLERLFEPHRVLLRTPAHINHDVVEGLPPPSMHFFRVRAWLPIEFSNQHMIDFVLDDAAVQGGFVDEREDWLQRAIEPHLFSKTPMSRREHRFTRQGMTATRVRPQAARVILARGASLQKETARPIEDEDRKGAMTQTLAVRAHPLLGANLAVVPVHQDYFRVL